MSLAMCLTLLTSCIGNVVAYYRSFADTSSAVRVFVPDLTHPSHSPLTSSTIRDLAEFPDNTIGAVTETGSLIFDSQWKVADSAMFSQSYLDVAIVQFRNTSLIYAEAHPVRDSLKNWYIRDYHVYRFGESTPIFSFSCSTSSVFPYRGRPVIDLSGDGTSSIVIPCERADKSNFLAFLNLANGTVRTLEIPFRPSVFLVGTSHLGKQSVIVLADYPRTNVLDIDDRSPINRQLDLRRYQRAVFTVEESTVGDLKGVLTHEIPNFESLMHNEIPALRMRVVLDHESELLFNDELYPGHTLVQWRFDGTLKNWWYFDLPANFRMTSQWVNDRGRYKIDEVPASIAVQRGWGHWCQWYPCQDAIVLLRPNGMYKLIDITTQHIDDLLLTSEGSLLATRKGKVYEYDLETLQENVAWRPSVVPQKHLNWISLRSGLPRDQIKKESFEPNQQQINL